MAQRKFEAHSLFVDLSGFTSITAALMQHGTGGAEALSNLLNQLFSPLVSRVYAYGGYIPYFAGDAFTAIFEGRSADEVLHLGLSFIEEFSDKRFESSFGDFKIDYRIGIHYGPIESGIVGNSQRAFYYKGSGLDLSAKLTNGAATNSLVISENFRSMLGNLDLQVVPFEERFIVPIQENRQVLDRIKAPEVLMQAIDNEIIRQFLPDAVFQYNQPGEFRNVVSIFLAFDGIHAHKDIDRFVSILLNKVSDFSGYFKEIDYSEKGSFAVLFFGAPIAFEYLSERALEFIVAVQAELQQAAIEGLSIKAGMSYGLAYAGMVGGYERVQYSLVGNSVNLAARYMIKAKWGQVLVDRTLAKEQGYSFKYVGDIKYKGIKEAESTHALTAKKIKQANLFKGKIIGRQSELNNMQTFIDDCLEQKKGGVVYVYGEAGIGKSRLIHEIHQIYKKQEVNWFYCPVDQILQKSLNPFLYFFQNYFFQRRQNSLEENRRAFEAQMNHLILRDGSENEAVKDAILELNRTQKILGNFLSLKYNDAVWNSLDAKGRLENTLASMDAFFTLHASLKPTILLIEDAHWIDEMSFDFINRFQTALEKLPIVFLITARYKDDGATLSLHPTAQEQQISEIIHLRHLDEQGISQYLEESLGSAPSPELVGLLTRSSNGNPFYLEQVQEYLLESDQLIMQDGLWYIKDEHVRISTSIQDILMARIDRLSSMVKETVKAAAVIGREFEVPILNEVMVTQPEFVGSEDPELLLLEQVKTAEKGQIWQAVNELSYMFKHALLREAVYDMQLRSRLGDLHKLIAQAIEKLYKDQLESKYDDLAYHYEQAGVKSKTMEYLEKVVIKTKRNFRNNRAIRNSNKLIQYAQEEQKVILEIKSRLRRGTISELIGDWEAAKDDFSQCVELAKSQNELLLLGRAYNNLGKLELLLGNYDASYMHLDEAIRLFESIDDALGVTKSSGDMGNLYLRQGEYEKAKTYFNAILAGNSINRLSYYAQIASNLGLAYMNTGDYEKGIQVISNMLEQCNEADEKQGMAALYTNLGVLYNEKGDSLQAEYFHSKGLELSKTLGNKLLTCINIGCLGNIHKIKGDYPKAKSSYEEDLKISLELGDKQGISIALGLIADLASEMGEFDNAMKHSKENLAITKSLGYQKGIAKALNTIADIFAYQKNYLDSLSHYNEAITVTRKIANKLVLGTSLMEKGFVHVQTEDSKEAMACYEEGKALADQLENTALQFQLDLLRARIYILEKENEAAIQILNHLDTAQLSSEQEAALCFTQYLASSKNNTLKNESLNRYEALYRSIPKYKYKLLINELKNA